MQSKGRSVLLRAEPPAEGCLGEERGEWRWRGDRARACIIHANNSGQQTLICLWENIKKMDISVSQITTSKQKQQFQLQQDLNVSFY